MGKWKLGQHFNSTATALNSTFANPCKPPRKPKFAKKLFFPPYPLPVIWHFKKEILFSGIDDIKALADNNMRRKYLNEQ
jgi:hypothetical protein